MSKKITPEEFIQKMNIIDNSIIILENYKASSIPIKCKCSKCGNIWKPLPRELLRGKGCRKCKMEKSNKFIAQNKMKCSKSTFLDRLNEKNLCYKNKDFDIISEYIGSKKEIYCKCNIHNFCWVTTPNELLKGDSCPKCQGSRMEKAICSFLNKNNIQYYREYSFKDCKDVYRLRFDFYLPTYNCCIEADGILHFKPIECFGGEEYFESALKRDKIKDDYCKNNNINLIRIKYTEFNQIENILTNYLNNNK